VQLQQFRGGILFVATLWIELLAAADASFFFIYRIYLRAFVILPR